MWSIKSSLFYIHSTRVWWTWSAVKEGSVLHRGARTWSLAPGERWGRSPWASRGAPPRTTTPGARWRSTRGCRRESGLSRLVPWPVTLQKFKCLPSIFLRVYGWNTSIHGWNTIIHYKKQARQVFAVYTSSRIPGIMNSDLRLDARPSFISLENGGF